MHVLVVMVYTTLPSMYNIVSHKFNSHLVFKISLLFVKI